MHRFATPLLSTTLLFAAELSAEASDEAAGARKVFKQSQSYPFIFQPPSYLATTGPVPLRFQPVAPPCDQRTAPPLPGPPKKAEPVAGKDADGAANVPALNAPQPSANPAPEESIDFGRVPNEVLEFFRSHDGQATRRIYLFDPIFQPARANDLPKSKASYTHTP